MDIPSFSLRNETIQMKANGWHIRTFDLVTDLNFVNGSATLNPAFRPLITGYTLQRPNTMYVHCGAENIKRRLRESEGGYTNLRLPDWFLQGFNANPEVVAPTRRRIEWIQNKIPQNVQAIEALEASLLRHGGPSDGDEPDCLDYILQSTMADSLCSITQIYSTLVPDEPFPQYCCPISVVNSVSFSIAEEDTMTLSLTLHCIEIGLMHGIASFLHWPHE
jgi:hypothetical protein